MRDGSEAHLGGRRDLGSVRLRLVGGSDARADGALSSSRGALLLLRDGWDFGDFGVGLGLAVRV